MIVEPDLVTHWKTKALANALGGMGPALQAILLLWGHCQQRKAWQFQLTPLRLAGICAWEGNADKLWNAMLELPLIEPVPMELGWYEVHQWADRNSALIHNWGARSGGWDPKGKTHVPAKNERSKGASKNGSRGHSEELSLDGSEGKTLDTTIGLDRIDKSTVHPPSSPPKAAAALRSDSPKAAKILWGAGMGWQNIEPEQVEVWKRAFPACDVERQLAAMHAWLLANRDRAVKSNWNRFITNWLKREQDKGGDLRGQSNSVGFKPGFSAEKKEGGPGAAATLKPAAAEPEWDWRGLAAELWGRRPDGRWFELAASLRHELRQAWAVKNKKNEGGAGA